MPDFARALFLQSLISHRVLPEVDARALYEAAGDVVAAAGSSNHGASTSSYEDFLLSASNAVGHFGLEVRRRVDEVTGRPVVALVNTRADELAMAASAYTPAEIAYIRGLIEAIYTAPRRAYSVTTMRALKEGGKMTPPLTKKATEELLNSLVSHQTGRLTLTSRTLLELQNYLKEEYAEDVLSCAVCHDVVTRGSACGAPTCTTGLHLPCARTVTGAAGQRGTYELCPGCGAGWRGEDVGGEEGEEEGEEGRGGRRRGRPSAGGRRAQSDDDDDDDDDDGDGDEDGDGGGGGDGDEDDADDGRDDEDDDAEEEASPARARARARSPPRRTSRRREHRDDEDDDDEEEEEEEQAPSAGKRRRVRAPAVRASESGEEGEEGEDEED